MVLIGNRWGGNNSSPFFRRHGNRRAVLSGRWRNSSSHQLSPRPVGGLSRISPRNHRIAADSYSENYSPSLLYVYGEFRYILSVSTFSLGCSQALRHLVSFPGKVAKAYRMFINFSSFFFSSGSSLKHTHSRQLDSRSEGASTSFQLRWRRREEEGRKEKNCAGKEGRERARKDDRQRERDRERKGEREVERDGAYAGKEAAESVYTCGCSCDGSCRPGKPNCINDPPRRSLDSSRTSPVAGKTFLGRFIK